jgi:hypothetical protein
VFRAGLAAAAWLTVALSLSLGGVTYAVPMLVPLLALGAIAAGVAAYRRGGAVRALADGLDLRWPIALHLLRAPIGAWILLETSRGVVPTLFGHRAGPGDIAIGVLAVVAIAAAAAPAASVSAGSPAFGARGAGARARAWVLAAWCVLGIVDLAIAFGTAQYLLLVVDDPLMSAISRLPWALLPTAVVPLMILTHLLVLARLRAGR